jgi:hypothetical protein
MHVPNEECPATASLESEGLEGIDVNEIAVQVTTVDAVCNISERVDLVKIDVEGLEEKVLKGMQRVIADSRPALIIECLPGVRLHEAERNLQNLGYTFWRLTPGRPLPLNGLSPDMTRVNRNVLCIPDTHSLFSELSHWGQSQRSGAPEISP